MNNKDYREHLKTLTIKQLFEEFDCKRAVLKPDAAGLESGKIIVKKIAPQYFSAVKRGAKQFELRKDEDKVCSGDILVLKEYDKGKFTGNQVSREVKYVLRNYAGLENGYCIIGL